MTADIALPDTKALSSALDVVANPAAYCSVPVVYASSWAILKAGRGQMVDFDRLGRSAHLIAPDTSNDGSVLRARVRSQVHRVARAKGYSLREARFNAGAAT
jgi:hypothetical protein